MTVPYLVLRGIDMRQAVVVSSAVAIPISFIGAIGLGMAGVNTEVTWGYVHLSAFLAIGAVSVLFANAGARLSQRMDKRKPSVLLRSSWPWWLHTCYFSSACTLQTTDRMNHSIKTHHRILLTGAAGQLGQVLRDALRSNCDVLRLSDKADLGSVRPGEEVVQADLTDRAAIDRAVAGCDAIVHFGAYRWRRPLKTSCRPTSWVSTTSTRRPGHTACVVWCLPAPITWWVFTIKVKPSTPTTRLDPMGFMV